jgi:predicted TIM-barrel fold metal-dependent hydrolase
MASRRDVLLALVAGGAATLNRRLGGLLNSDEQPGFTPVNFAVPARACDCHVHVFGDATRFPFSPDRPYTPPPAPVDDLRRLHRQLHMERVVIVTPAVYGTNNDCTLDAIRQLGSNARGVALVAPDATGPELDRLTRGGICGVRLNFETFGLTDPNAAVERFQLASSQVTGHGWHIQINTRLSVVEALERHILRGPATAVFDHFAQAEPALGVDQPGFAALVRLLQSGRAYAKVSGAYRISKQVPDYPDVAPLAHALIAANSERILWGSDWPHPDAARVPGRSATDVRPPLPVDDGRVLNQLAVWAPDATIRQRILVDNPARLYGF